jgi:hypothetical protein
LTPGHAVRTCIFCGRPGPFTAEHVWGRWLYKHLFDPSETAVIVRGVRDEGGDVSSTKPYNKDLNIVTRAVCGRCNGGWMKHLEDRLNAMLIRSASAKGTMLRGQPASIGPKGQKLLARWSVKTAVTRDSADEPQRRVIARNFCDQLCQGHGRPPPLTLVFLGWYIGEYRIAQWGRRLTPLIRPGMELAPQGFSSTFSVGQVIFQVLRLNEEADHAAASEAADELSLLRIWPPTHPHIVWPPMTYHTDQSLRSFATRQICV